MKNVIIIFGENKRACYSMPSWELQISFQAIFDELGIMDFEDKAIFFREVKGYFLPDNNLLDVPIPDYLESVTLSLTSFVTIRLKVKEDRLTIVNVPLSQVIEGVSIYDATICGLPDFRLKSSDFLRIGDRMVSTDKPLNAYFYSIGLIWTVTKVKANISVYQIEDNQVKVGKFVRNVRNNHKTIFDVFPEYRHFDVISPSCLKGLAMDSPAFLQVFYDTVADGDNFDKGSEALDPDLCRLHFTLVDRNTAFLGISDGSFLSVYQNVGVVASTSTSFANIVKAFPLVYHPKRVAEGSGAVNKKVDWWHTPFIHLAAPSRSGKTEFAIALDSYSEYPCYEWPAPGNEKKFSCVLHFVCSSDSKKYGETQNIYTDLKASANFRNFIREDLKTIYGADGANKKNVSGSDIIRKASNKELKAVGYIYKIAEQLKDGKKLSHLELFQFKPMSIFEFRKNSGKVLAPYGEKRGASIQFKPMIICLDEFNLHFASDDMTSSDDSISSKEDKYERDFLSFELIFIRNLVGELGSYAVLLGTDISAARFLSRVAMGSRRSFNGTGPWATIVTRLPLATALSVERLMADILLSHNISTSLEDTVKEKLPTMFHWLWRQDQAGQMLVSCRPGFLRIFFKYLVTTDRAQFNNDLDFFEEIVAGTFGELSALKDIKNTNMGRLGQYLLLFSRNRTCESGRYPDELIHRHFAFVEYAASKKHMKGPIIECDRDRVKGRTVMVCRNHTIKNPLSVFTVFPPSIDDELGQIILTSSFKNCSPFDETALEATSQAFQAKNLNLRFSSKQSADEPDRLGLFLEMATTSNLILSSHGRLSGTRFIEYLAKVVGGFCSQPELISFDEIPENFKGIAEIVIPYIYVANSTFSTEFRSIYGVYTATQYNTKNQNECDGIILSDNISNECLLRRSVTSDQHDPVEIVINGKVGMKIAIVHEEKNTADKTDGSILVPVSSKMNDQCSLVPEAQAFIGIIQTNSLARLETTSWLEVVKVAKGFKFIVVERRNGKNIIWDPLADINYSPVFKRARTKAPLPKRTPNPPRNAIKRICYDQEALSASVEGEETDELPPEQIRYLVFLSGESFSGRPFSSLVTIRPADTAS